LNEKNLIPNSQRTPEELREMTRKGGIASGIARRKKKETAELINIMLSSKLNDKNKKAVKSISEELEDDDLTVNSLMIAGQIKSAINGNVKAFEILQQYSQTGQKQDDSDNFIEALKGQVKETFSDSGGIVEE
jgi:phage terminase large subunit